MLNNKQNESSHRARKMIGILLIALFPVISFAQGYMMDFNRGMSNELSYSHSFWFLPFIFIFPVIGVIVTIAVLIFWIMMLIDAIKHSPEKTKLIWVVVIIFTHVIGALIYYFVEKRPRDRAKMHGHREVENNDEL